MSRSSSARRLLLPLNPAYRLALALRELSLRLGMEPVRRLRWPVVSVGSLSAGGAGKTPMTIALAKALSARGFGVDVLSRGYGRKSREAVRVRPEGAAEEFGDEPLLIARATGLPVCVASQRYEAGRMAEEGAKSSRMVGASLASGAKAPDNDGVSMYGLKPVPSHDVLEPIPSNHWLKRAPSNDALEPLPLNDALELDGYRRVHLLDDGFQHRQLARDVDILLLNQADWHAHLLPAGNLREPRKAVRRASVIAIPAEEPDLEGELRAWGWQGPIWRLRRKMEIPAIAGPVAAFCGIARPEQFFRGLESGGMRIAARRAFADHHRFISRELDGVIAEARAAGAAAVITTEKDRVRIGALSDRFPKELPLLSAGLRIEIEDEAVGWLVKRLAEIAGA
jgi:tetraacyldisaccharide 4'-kinase